MWDKMAKNCDSLFRINVETGAYVRRCAVNRSDTAGLYLTFFEIANRR